MDKGIIALAAALVAVAGCGAERRASPAAVDTLVLDVVDTIGCDGPDTSQVFGLLRSAEWTPDGCIAVLDMHRGAVQLFSADGVELSRLGRSGEGPGEFSIPGTMTVLGDGSIAVADLVGGKVVVFGPGGSLLREIRGFSPTPPLELQGLDDTSYAAMSMSMTAAGGDAGGSLRLVRYSGTAEPDQVYAEYPMELGNRVGDSRNPRFDFACTPDGRVIVSEQSDTLLYVRRFARDGSEDLSLRRGYERIPWPEEERGEALALSIMMENGNATTEARSVPVEDEYRTVVNSIHCDSLGRIWLEMTDTAETRFEVLSPEGDLLFVAVPGDPEILEGCSFSITPHGMLAIDANPDDWPKVLLLELRDRSTAAAVPAGQPDGGR